MQNVSKTIKEYRIKNNYTQEQLASICSVSRQAVTKWEAGTSLPDIEKMILLARLFHITVDELLTGNMPVSPSDNKLKESYDQNEKIINQALKKAMACTDPDDQILQFISYIGSQIRSDRMYIFEPKPDGSYMNTYEWCNDRVSSQKEYLQNIPLKDLSVWMNSFSRGEYVYIEDVEALIERDPVVYRWLKPQGIHSLLVCPLFEGRCFLGADNPTFAFIKQTSSLMDIMIHFVESLLQQRDLTQKLNAAIFENRQFSHLSNSIRYQLNVITGQLTYDDNQIQKLDYAFQAQNYIQLDEALSKHPECHDHILMDGIQKAIETKENLSIEFISYKRNHMIRWNRLSISPFIDNKGKVLQLYGLLQDISNEHQIIEQYNKYISHLSGGLHICYLSTPIHLSYASDDLCAFLGYSREEFDTVVGSIYTNIIVEEDRHIFLGFVQSLSKACRIQSCEYRIRKKDGSISWVIDTMESIADSNGTMYGYSYILEKQQMHSMLKMAEDNEKRHLALINVQYEVLESLGKDYLNIFRVWLDEDKAQIINLNGYVTKGMNKESTDYIPYYRFCKQYVQDRIHPDDKAKMLKAMHPDTVREALTKEDDYIVIYRAIDHDEIHYYQLKYVRLQDESSPDLINFVAGFKNVDKVIEQEHQQQKELQSRLRMINAILLAFTCAYYIDYESGTFTELTCDNDMIRNINGKSGKISQAIVRMILLFGNNDASKHMNDFFNGESLKKRLQGNQFVSTKIAINENDWYEMNIFVVDYDENGNISHCIFAARDISKEKKQEEEYIRSLGIANNRERMAMQYAYVDALTGLMNRNAFERDFKSLDTYSNIGIIYSDVNNLKETNDTYGHNQGDTLLKSFAQILKEHFSVDCIYRIGGDEFICIIGNIDHDSFTQRVNALIDDVIQNQQMAAIGYSYGASNDEDHLLEEAEKKMYDMKNEQKRNKIKAGL